ncbi:thiol:disulfide interchange protein DsbA [Chitinivorax tropicus]|uniref:Thiol:disulfide interchange protein n=1 Tax=Chitinivorax tropicus TaxID=714531 RepID=A0A840MY65_9PROT|nr:thiol:disulfide interchange protein DsbA/DsbL [Chitinivorax tropicus]MBB5020091.1 thiol:disulfide interchange protein DsbA [Chitinivorax tropicus]
MTLLKRLFAAVTVAGVMAAGAAHAGEPYTTLPQPQPTQSKDKIEILEFFSYHCPHCYHLDPGISAWAAKLPADVQFRRVHVAWPGMTNIQPYTKLFHTMQALGVQDKLHTKLFDAVQRDKVEVRNPEIAADWFSKQGVDKAKFNQAWSSFGVESAARQAENISKNYRVDGVPTVIVNGKYKTSLADVGGESQLFALLDQLIDQERKAMGGKKPADSKKPAEKK